MTTETTEDVLGELYAWDSIIDDVFALSRNDPQRDEDDALDAYEEVIQLASRPGDGGDSVLSLAAQLLTKHFFKFPHVHLNVIDVMLALCGAQRPQAVRIHTIRSLLQIVKTPVSDTEPLARECVDRIQQVIATLVENEPSPVIMRHMIQLGKALKERRDAKVPVANVPAENTTSSSNVKLTKKQSAKAEKLKKKADRAAEKEREAKKEKEREAKKKKQALVATTSTFSSALRAVQEEAAVAQEQQQPSDRERHKLRRASWEDHVDKDTVKASRDDRRSVVDLKGSSSREDRRVKEESVVAVRRDGDERRSRVEELLARPADSPRGTAAPPTPVAVGGGGGFDPHSCPPGPYLFMGNLATDLDKSDIVAYLSEVDPSLTTQGIQIKSANHRSSNHNFAFVSLSTTQLAREAIRFVTTVKLRGRIMHANFARGPPCHVLSFIERNKKARSMEDVDAVRDFNFAKCNRMVWERLCDKLRTYGELKVLEVGKVRFTSLDAAKEVIRQHHFTVEGCEIIMIYEPEDQLKIDSTRRFGMQPQQPKLVASTSGTVRQSFALKSGRVVGDRGLNEEIGVPPPVESVIERRSEPVAEARNEKRDRKTDERKNRKRSSSPKISVRKTRERSPSPAKKKRDNQQRSRSRSVSPAPLKSKPQHLEARGRRSGSHSRSPVASFRKHKNAQGRSKSPHSVSPVTSKKQSKSFQAKHSPSRSRSPTPPSRKQQKSRGRSKSRSESPPVAFRKRESRSHRSKSPVSPPVQSKKQEEREYESRPVKKQYSADRSRSRSPLIVKERKPSLRRESPPALLSMPIDSRGPPYERTQSRRKSRSRSPERERFVPRDMSSYGPSRRDDGGKQQQHEREQHPHDSDHHQPLERKQHERERNARDNDQPFKRSRPEPERRGSGGKMSRYGPAGSNEAPSHNSGGGREERRNDHQAPKRDSHDSPPRVQMESILGDHVPGPPRSEQRRGSRSPPRFGGDRNRSKSPQSRRPADGPRHSPPRGDNGGRGGRGRNDDNGGRGGHDRERNEHRPLERKNSGSRRDDRSIAEIAHEEQERIDRLQQHSSRRDSYAPSGGKLSKYGDAGRGDHFGTPPPLRDGGRPRGASFQKPRSRSPPGRPIHNEFASRDRSHQSPLVPPHVRDFNRGLKNSPQFDHQHARTGNNMRDSPHLDHQKPRGNNLRDPPLLDLQKRERRESYGGGRPEGRRGRSPPPSPLMTASDRRASAPLAGGGDQRRRSRSKTHERADERERKGSRRSDKESRPSGDQNNRDRANHQGNDRSKGRQQPYSPVLTSPPVGKRLRSLTPSPVRRDNHRAKTSRERSRSPILKRPGASAAAYSNDEPRAFTEKKRRIDDNDVLLKPASAPVFDDLDEMMVDYEEDD